MNVRIESSKSVYECIATDINNAIDKYIEDKLGFTTGFSLSAELWGIIKSSVDSSDTRIELVNGLCKSPFNKITRIISNFAIDYPALPALDTPDVTISANGLATWPEVENAIGYQCTVNGSSRPIATDREVQLYGGYTFTVKAIGDGYNYADSDYCAVLTYSVQA